MALEEKKKKRKEKKEERKKNIKQGSKCNTPTPKWP